MSLTVEVGRGYVHILELNDTTGNFLFKVSEAKEGDVCQSYLESTLFWTLIALIIALVR